MESVPFAVNVGSNEEDRPRNLLFKPLPDNAGEGGDQGVYLLEEPVQERAPIVLSEVPATDTNITEMAPQANLINGPPEGIIPNSGQEPYLVEEPVQDRAPPALFKDPAAETYITEIAPEEDDHISSPRQRISSTLGKSPKAIGRQREQVSSGQEPPRQTIPFLRQKTQEEHTAARAEKPMKGIHKATEEIELNERNTAKLFAGLDSSQTKAPVQDVKVEKEVTRQGERQHERLSDEAGQPSESRRSHMMRDEAYREMCGRRLRNFLVDDSTDLRSPIDSHKSLRDQALVDGWVTVVVEEADAVTQTSQVWVPTPKELIAVANDASVAHGGKSPFAIEKELDEGTQTIDRRESVSVHAQDADKKEFVLLELEAEIQTSQKRLSNIEESAMTNDASLVQTPVTVEKQPQEDRQTGRLQPNDLVPTPLRPTHWMGDDTFKELCGQRLKKFLEDNEIDLGTPNQSTLESPHHVTEEAPDALRHESLRTLREQEPARRITSIQGSQHVIEETASSEKLTERMSAQQEAMQSVPSLLDPNRVSSRTRKMKPRRLMNDVEQLTDSTEMPQQVLPRVSVHPEDTDEQESEVEELDEATQTSQVWLPNAEERIATTTDASLASEQERLLAIMENPPEGGHIDEASSQEEQTAATAETPMKGIHKATEETEHNERHSDKLFAGLDSSGTKAHVQDIKVAKEVTPQGRRHDERLSDEGGQTSARLEERVQDIHHKSDERLQEAIHPGKPSSQVQEVSATSSKSKQDVQPATKETRKIDDLRKMFGNKELISQGPTTYRQSVHPVREKKMREDRHLGKPSGQIQQVSAKSSEPKQDIGPATQEELLMGKLPEKIISKQQPIPPGTKPYRQSLHISPEKTLHEDQHLGKPSGQLQQQSATSSKWKQDIDPATKQTLKTDDIRKIFDSKKPILPGSTTYRPSVHPVIEKKMREDRHLGKPSGQLQQITATSTESKQGISPATQEELIRHKLPENIISKQQPIPPGPKLYRQSLHFPPEKSLRGNQHLGKLSGQLQQESATSSKSKQDVDPATKQTLKMDHIRKIFDSEKPILPGSTTYRPSVHPVREKKMREDQHLGKRSGQLQQITATSTKPKQGIGRATQEELIMHKLPENIIKKQQPIPPGPKPYRQSLHLPPEKTLRGDQHLGKPSGQLQQESATSSKSKQDEYLATKKTFKTDDIRKIFDSKEPILPGSTYRQSVHPVRDEKMREDRHLEKPSGQLQQITATSTEPKQDFGPATREELRMDRLPEKIISKQQLIPPWTKTYRQSVHLPPEKKLRGDQHFGKPSGQLQQIAATPSQPKQDTGPATQEKLFMGRTPEKIISKQQPIPPGPKPYRQSLYLPSEKTLRGDQHLGKRSGQLQQITTTSTQSKQGIGHATQEKLFMNRPPEKVISKQQPIPPGTKPYRQSFHLPSEKTLRGDQHLGKPSGQLQQITATSTQPKQGIGRATQEKLVMQRPPEKILSKQQPIPPGPKPYRQSLYLPPEKTLRGDQHLGKRSGQLQQESATSSKSKQIVQPATKETLQMDIGQEERITPGSATYLQGVRPVTEKKLFGGLRSKIPVYRQEEYTIKPKIPVRGTQPAKEETSEGRTSPGAFPYGQKSVSSKPVGSSTTLAGQAPGRLRPKPDLISPAQAESKPDMHSVRGPDKLKFWQEKALPKTTQETTEPKPKPPPKE